MQLFAIFVAFWVWATSNLIVTALALPDTAPSASGLSPEAFGIVGSYQMGVPTFQGNFKGNNITLQGTSKDVISQLEAMLPGSTNNITELAAEAALASQSSNLMPRYKNGILCTPVAGQSFTFADKDGIHYGIGYLNFLHDNGFTMTVAPRYCQVLTCNRQASIIWCNDNYNWISTDLSYLASYASDITYWCNTGGQQFDTENYNIITAGSGNC